MPKLLDLKSVLNDFSYKPNFGFTLYTRDGREMIKITMVVEDSRAPLDPWRIQPAPRREVVFGDDLCVRRKFQEDNIVGYSPPRHVTEVWGKYAIPYFDSTMDVEFVEWLRNRIRKMEDHEMDEWLRYKGELVNDPHKETD